MLSGRLMRVGDVTTLVPEMLLELVRSGEWSSTKSVKHKHIYIPILSIS